MKTTYPYVVKELSELTTKYNVPFVDLNIEFNKDIYKQKQLLVDYCHLSPLGGETIANKVFTTVDSLLIKQQTRINN